MVCRAIGTKSLGEAADREVLGLRVVIVIRNQFS